MALSVVPARFPADLEAVRGLLREYQAGLGVDLSFQGFEHELVALPGDYAPPGGALLLVRDDGGLAGCVALRRIDDATCEMKRLYVRPSHRGLGVGRTLVDAVMDAARQRRYLRMRLDTLPSMREAIAMYRRLGFRPIEPYRANPVPGALYLERDL